MQASLDYYNAKRYTPHSSEALATLADLYYTIAVAKDYDGAIWRLLRQTDILDIALQMFRRSIYELDRYALRVCICVRARFVQEAPSTR